MEKFELYANPKDLVLFDNMSIGERKLIREQSLENLVGFAKEKIAFYKALDVPKSRDFSLSELPVIQADELYFDYGKANFFGIDKQKAISISEKRSGFSKEEYAVCMDKNLPVLYSRNALYTERAILEKRVLGKYAGKKTAVLLPPYKGSFAELLFGNTKRFPKPKTLFIDVNEDISDIADKLDKFKPQVLAAYPTKLELLAGLRERGLIDYSPKLIVAFGEYICEFSKKRIEKAFDCRLQSIYMKAETGIIACECEKGHLHINEDWKILEPVDRDYDYIGYGKKSDTALLTSLSNYTEPFIRLDIQERIVLHDEACSCKNKSAWIEWVGKENDFIDFKISDDVIIRILPISLTALLKQQRDIELFQLIVRKNEIEFRLKTIPGADRELVYKIAEEKLLGYLYACEVKDVLVYLSENEPVFEEDGTFVYAIQPEREKEICYESGGDTLSILIDKHEE